MLAVYTSLVEAAALLEAVPQGSFDVAISATSEDGALAEFIKGENMIICVYMCVIAVCS